MDGDLPRQIALGDRRRHQRDVPHLGRQPVRHGVHGVREVLPGPGHPAHLRLPAELALGTHLDGDPGHLLGEHRQLVDQVVDRTGDLQELAAQRPDRLVRRVRPQLHPLLQITVGDRRQDPAHFGDRSREIVDELVGGVDRGGPGTLAGARLQPLRELPLPADHAPHTGQLTGEVEITVRDLVEDRRDLRHHAVAGDGEPPTEVSVAHRHEAREQSVQSCRVHFDGAIALLFHGLSAFCTRLRTLRRHARLHRVPPAGVDRFTRAYPEACPVPLWLTATAHRQRATGRTSNRCNVPGRNRSAGNLSRLPPIPCTGSPYLCARAPLPDRSVPNSALV
ncbi:hypothetical protein SPW_5086 [Streptomyces sp. W007]|nr:hypothetical protein SPW_5086 [Streptomyces sp. W007]